MYNVHVRADDKIVEAVKSLLTTKVSRAKKPDWSETCPYKESKRTDHFPIGMGVSSSFSID